MASRPGRTLSGSPPPPSESPRGGVLAGASRRFGLAIAIAIAAGALAGDALHLSGARSLGSGPPAKLSLPTFHGQGEWKPGQRPAPGFVLHDQTGAGVSLAAQRGKPVLIAFLHARSRAGSGPEARSLAQALAIVPRGRRPILDVVSLDPGRDTRPIIETAVDGWRLRGPYHWLSGSGAELARVCREYGAPTPAAAGGGRAPIYLVDRSGFERAGFLYPFFPTVLAHDLETLSRHA